MRYCRNCGSPMKDGEKFCKECGSAVQKPKRAEQQVEEHKPEKQMEQQADNDHPEPFSKTVGAEASAEKDEPGQVSEQRDPEQTEEQHTPEQQPKQTAITQRVHQNRGKNAFFKSKKSKILTGILIALVIVLFGSYYTIHKMMSPEAVSDRFMDAVAEKDVEQLRTFINEGQLEMKATKADVEAFLAFLDVRPNMITAISDQLAKDVQGYMKNRHYADPVSGMEGKPLVTLKKEGKKWLLFDHYVVSVVPVYMEVTSTEDETMIFVGGKEVGTVSKKERKLGPFLPGIYEVKAVVDGDYGKVEDVEEADFSEMDEADVNPSFDFTDYYVDLYSDNRDAILYVNGKSTKEKIGDIGTLGPVPKDGSIELFAQKKFSTGVKKSGKVKVNKNTNDADLYLDYDKYDEEYDVAMEEAEKQSELAEEEEKVIDVIYDHYEGISNENYSSAYNLFSANMQQKFNPDKWEKGLADTLLDDVTLVEVESMDSATAKVYVEMTSYDEQDDDSVLVKDWEGYWTLVKENGKWKMDKSELEEVDSWTE